jgi:ubiquinone biosynthesis protein UbiJ
MLISIERDDCAEQCESKTMKIPMDNTLLFWVDAAYEHIKSANSQLSKRQLVAQILRKYEQRGDALRRLNTQGEIVWKASPRFLTMLTDAERDARDDLAEFP